MSGERGAMLVPDGVVRVAQRTPALCTTKPLLEPPQQGLADKGARWARAFGVGPNDPRTRIQVPQLGSSKETHRTRASNQCELVLPADPIAIGVSVAAVAVTVGAI